jgi:hypothetical protein
VPNRHTRRRIAYILVTSIDFITRLPKSKSYTILLIVTNYLSKDLVLIPLSSIDTEIVAKKFIKQVVSYY